jgi:hypothetical protein
MPTAWGSQVQPGYPPAENVGFPYKLMSDCLDFPA